MLRVGQPAPGFELPDADMQLVSLESFRNKCGVVVYFYPKNFSPGCTTEAIEFSDLLDGFARRKVEVLGVSGDDIASHAAFRDEHGLGVRLLSDADGETARAYAVVQEKVVDGKPHIGVRRSTFIVDRHGVLRHVLYGVKAAGHAAEVLELVKGMK